MTTELKYMSVLFKNYMLPPDKIPMVVSNTILAGQFFGETGLAVVSFFAPIYFLFETVGYWINYGAFSKSIESIGKNETELARSYSKLALILSIVAGILVSIAVIFMFQKIVIFFEIPEELHSKAMSYGMMLAVSGIFLVIASYFWHFVKLIGLQARIRKIYLVIMLVDIVAVCICVKIFGLGIESLSIGMLVTDLFIILMAGMWLKNSMGSNWFATIQRPVESIKEIFLAGSAASAGKFYSLVIVLLFNWGTMKFFGVEGVAIFAVIQVAMRICRLHSQVTWQPLSPILTMEFADKNEKSMQILLKHSLKQAIIMAVLPAIVIFIGADYFMSSPDISESIHDFAVKSFRAYSLSVVFAAINSIFIIWYSIINRRILANVLEFLRTLVFVVIFLRFITPDQMFGAFIFAECVTLILIIASRYILKNHDFNASTFFVVDRQIGLNDENQIPEKYRDFISKWIDLVKNFSDTPKNNFTSVHIIEKSNETQITLRSMGNLFDYRENDRAMELLKNLDGLIYHKITFTLGMNNLYLKISH